VSLDRGGPVVYCKLEYMNPSGSLKDRIARGILQNAWKRGQIDEHTTVVEKSSGSTSIAQAHACCHMGLRFRAVLPAGASLERRLTTMAHGGEVETVPEDAGLDAARQRAEELAEPPGYFCADQCYRRQIAERGGVSSALRSRTGSPIFRGNPHVDGISDSRRTSRWFPLSSSAQALLRS
jgi:cysteine synthase